MRCLVLAAALACFACGPAERQLARPDLPELNMEEFLPAIRKEIVKASEGARAQPNDAGASGRLGMVLQAHEQFSAAEICYRRAHHLDSAAFRWLYLLGIVEALQGKNEDAVATLRRAIGLDASYVPAKLRLAEVLLELGRLDDSKAVYEEILRKDENWAAAHYGLGRIRSALGDDQGAAEAFRRAVELHPEYGSAHYALAAAYRKLGDPRAAEHLPLHEKFRLNVPPARDPLMAEVRSLSRAVTAYIREGTELEAAGKLDASVAAHLKALELNPSAEQAHVNLIALYGRLGQTDKAEEHYRKVIAVNPNLAEAHYNFGVLAFDRKRFAEAKRAFDETLRINPNHPDAHNNLGYLVEMEGSLPEAEKHYREAVRNKPDLRLAWFHLGRLLVNRGDYSGAIAAFEKTLTPEDENTAGYLYALGAAHGRSGDHARAIEHLRQARAKASALNQAGLLASIDRDLRLLERAPTSPQ